MVDLSQLCSFNAQKLPKIKKVALFQKLLPELLDVFMWTLLKVLLFVLHSDFQHRSINVARTLSEKTNYHNNTIFRNNKLADNMWKIREYFHFLLFLRRDWEAILKTRALGFLRVSIHSKTIKAIGLPPRASIRWNPSTRFWNST